MENSNPHNTDPEIEFEELMQNLEIQKSDLEALRAKINIRLRLTEKNTADTKRDAAKRLTLLELSLTETEQLLFGKEIECKRLLEKIEKLKAEAERMEYNDRLIQVIKKSCVKLHSSSKKFWTIRRFAAIHFMEFVAKILNRYKMFTQDEFDIVFPQKAAKRIKSLAIRIPTEDEKKKKLRDWKRIWRWKKDT